MRITTIQSTLHWEDKKANILMFEEKISLAEETDIIILPEMFSTGFSMNAAALAEQMDGETAQWMHIQAKQKQAVITGSLIIEEAGKFYNRLLWVQPDGTCRHYDKKHLFGMANEQQHYSAGNRKVVVDYQGWRFCLLVCYDLRFPVWNRNAEDYDVAIYVANWPQRRSAHWKALLQARAIENQAFVFAVNRVGTDGKGLYYSGDSSVILPNGEILYQKADAEDIFRTEIKKELLTEIRQQLPFLRDRDVFSF